MKLRITPQTLIVLNAFLDAHEDWKYGYDISRNTGLKSGTLYPILMRLAERKLLETAWEVGQPGRPPRHMYRFTPEGLKVGRAHPLSRPTAGSSRAPIGQIGLGQKILSRIAAASVALSLTVFAHIAGGGC